MNDRSGKLQEDEAGNQYYAIRLDSLFACYQPPWQATTSFNYCTLMAELAAVLADDENQVVGGNR